MVSKFIQYLKETDPSKVPNICGTERYSGPTEFEKIIKGSSTQMKLRAALHLQGGKKDE